MGASAAGARWSRGQAECGYLGFLGLTRMQGSRVRERGGGGADSTQEVQW